MNISDRVKILINENNLKQKEFAKSINVTESYISKLIRGDSGLSNSTAMLIEELYGYSADWILNGVEPKMKNLTKYAHLSPIQKKVLFDVEKLDFNELLAVKAFIDSLVNVKESLKN